MSLNSEQSENTLAFKKKKKSGLGRGGQKSTKEVLNLMTRYTPLLKQSQLFMNQNVIPLEIILYMQFRFSCQPTKFKFSRDARA